MIDLIQYRANICLTAAGVLIHDGKILLVKHKKLGLWLNPGGHIEPNELPHQAAEREFWEETAIKVAAKPFGLMGKTTDVELVPSPFSTSLHWVSRENYEARVQDDPSLAANRKYTGRSCEQHLNFCYLVEPVAGLDYSQNVEETDGIAWFTPAEVDELDVFADIKLEIKEAFRLSRI